MESRINKSVADVVMLRRKINLQLRLANRLIQAGVITTSTLRGCRDQLQHLYNQAGTLVDDDTLGMIIDVIRTVNKLERDEVAMMMGAPPQHNVNDSQPRAQFASGGRYDYNYQDGRERNGYNGNPAFFPLEPPSEPNVPLLQEDAANVKENPTSEGDHKDSKADVPTHGEEVEAIKENVMCGPREEDSETDEPAQEEVVVVAKGLSCEWYDEVTSNDEPTLGNAVAAEQTTSSGSGAKETTNKEEHPADGLTQVDNTSEPLNEDLANAIQENQTDKPQPADVTPELHKWTRTSKDVTPMEPSAKDGPEVELTQAMTKVARMAKSAPQWISTSQDVDCMEPSVEDGPAGEQTHHMTDADGMAQDARWWTRVDPDWKRRKRKDGPSFGEGGVTGSSPTSRTSLVMCPAWHSVYKHSPAWRS
jgi:hypothetical protein